MFSKRTILHAIVLTGTVACTSLAAKATVIAPNPAMDYTFTYGGPNDSVYAIFTLPSKPTPSSYISNSMGASSFTLDGVSVWDNGTTYTTDLIFYKSTSANSVLPGGGGFFSHLSLVYGYGEQLFSGSVSNPTFMLGNYSLTQVGDPPLVIAQAPSSVTPEPESLLLMGTGLLALLGAAGLKRFA